MGNRVNKQERQRRELVKDEVFEKAKVTVQKRRENVSNALINYSSPQAFVDEAKETQLNRRGKPFTKADLIAILAKLENVNTESLEILKYQTLSCDDLRSYIRLKLYAEEALEEEKKEEPKCLKEQPPPTYAEITEPPPFEPVS